MCHPYQFLGHICCMVFMLINYQSCLDFVVFNQGTRIIDQHQLSAVYFSYLVQFNQWILFQKLSQQAYLLPEIVVFNALKFHSCGLVSHKSYIGTWASWIAKENRLKKFCLYCVHQPSVSNLKENFIFSIDALANISLIRNSQIG